LSLVLLREVRLLCLKLTGLRDPGGGFMLGSWEGFAKNISTHTRGSPIEDVSDPELCFEVLTAVSCGPPRYNWCVSGWIAVCYC
jgi:hypothetical protein